MGGDGDATKLPNAQVLDHVWNPVSLTDTARLAGRLLADILRVCGRSAEDVALFLNVPVAVVEAFLDGRPVSLSLKDVER